MSTYSDIYTSFNELTGDTRRYNFTREQVDRYAARALNETCERARYKDTAELINVVSGTALYPVTAEGYDIFRVEYSDKILYPITRDALRQSDRDWSSRVGLPRFYYLDEIYASAQDYMTVGLWKTPSASVADGLRVWYHQVPAKPSSASSLLLLVQVDIPDWASSAVLYFMLQLAFTADTNIQDHSVAAMYSLLYEDVLERLIMRSRDRQPKHWVSGGPAGPSRNVLNRLPQRITP